MHCEGTVENGQNARFFIYNCQILLISRELRAPLKVDRRGGCEKLGTLRTGYVHAILG